MDAMHGNLVSPPTDATTLRGAARLGFQKPEIRLSTQRIECWELGLPDFVSLKSQDVPCLIAVGGGKGGVGKSILSANLAAKLAQLGLRVLVVDLDLGCANIHTHFGIPRPENTLADLVVHHRKGFVDIITPTSVANVALVAGGLEAMWGRYLTRGSESLGLIWEEILATKRNFAVDVVLMDLGAGTLQHTIDFFTTAHLGICTVLPEPTSIENAYVFLKTYIWHLVENVASRTQNTEHLAEVRAALAGIHAGNLGSGYGEVLKRLADRHPHFIAALQKTIAARVAGIVINQSRNQMDADVGRSMELIVRRYFGLNTHFLGDLNFDDAAWKSLRNRRLLLSDFPHAALAKRLAQVAVQVLKVVSY